MSKRNAKPKPKAKTMKPMSPTMSPKPTRQYNVTVSLQARNDAEAMLAVGALAGTLSLLGGLTHKRFVVGAPMEAVGFDESGLVNRVRNVTSHEVFKLSLEPQE